MKGRRRIYLSKSQRESMMYEQNWRLLETADVTAPGIEEHMRPVYTRPREIPPGEIREIDRSDDEGDFESDMEMQDDEDYRRRDRGHDRRRFTITPLRQEPGGIHDYTIAVGRPDDSWYWLMHPLQN